MNVLGHELKLSIDDSSDVCKKYVCIKCDCQIDYYDYHENHKWLIWLNKINDYMYLISCDEYIIKSIIE